MVPSHDDKLAFKQIRNYILGGDMFGRCIVQRLGLVSDTLYSIGVDGSFTGVTGV